MELNSDKYNVTNAFNTYFYVVPEYQREYVWENSQVEQLLDDLVEEYDSKTQTGAYFIGTLLVCPLDKKDIGQYVEVIDGQQRLITIFLMLCALRFKFKGEKEVSILERILYYESLDGKTLAIDVQYENANHIMNMIVDLNESPANIKQQLNSNQYYGSSERILKAYECIVGDLDQKFSTIEQLRPYLQFIMSQLTFIQISSDFGSALKIFETINDRGVNLNAMDLVKNRIFSNVKDPSNFKKLNGEWKQITMPLEKGREKPLRFLKYFFISNYDVKEYHGKSNLKESELFKWFSDSNTAKQIGYNDNQFAFIKRIQDNVNHYMNYSRTNDSTGQYSSQLHSIYQMAGKTFRQHFILLLTISNLHPRIFNDFLCQLECYLFYIFFTKTQANRIEHNFAEWASSLRKTASISSNRQLLKSINDFAQDRFQDEMSEMESELNDALKRLSMSSSQKSKIKYFLARLTEHVQGEHDGIRTHGNKDYYKLQIEHILPENPKRDLLDEWIREDSTEDEAQDRYTHNKNLVGNLVLLEKPLNIVASNNFFSEKLKEYKCSRRYLTSSIASLSHKTKNTSITRINGYLSEYTTWGEGDIRKRHNELVRLAKKVWKISDIKG